jgi:hypothetical protein
MLAEPPTDTQERATFTDPTIVHTVADLRREALLAEVVSDLHATLGSARRR